MLMNLLIIALLVFDGHDGQSQSAEQQRNAQQNAAGNVPFAFCVENEVKHGYKSSKFIYCYRPLPPDKTAMPPTKQTPDTAARAHDKNTIALLIAYAS
jgi:hypothetical protein